MLVIGDREVESGEVSVRRYKLGDTGATSVGALVQLMGDEIAKKFALGG